MIEREARGGVLIVGGGFAGGYVARLLGDRGSTIVSLENYMLFTPILPEAASGTLEPRHVVVPLRQMCPHSELLLGRVQALDRANHTVAVEIGGVKQSVRYDQLVIALGAVPRSLPIPGLHEHALAFKDLADAIHLRNHVLRQLELAEAAVDPRERLRQLTFVFVGAGYAGVEALAELHDLVRDAIRYYRRLTGERQRWILVDAAPTILPEIPSTLGQYAARELGRRGVEIHTKTRLQQLDERSALLSTGERVETATLVWTAGIRPNPLLGELGLPLDERGAVRVDEFLRVEGEERIWALGDCARVPNPDSERPDPPTSQHALRQARRLARNVNGELKPYRYKMRGQVATLGRYKGIAQVGRVRLSGFLGWFVTRSYHLYQLPLLSRKLRVVTDWTVALAFRRDIAELGDLGHPRRIGS